MFRPPTDAEEELEQAWQLLWQAYGYPRGDIDELQQRLASIDRATMTTEYAALETRMIRLVRLEKFRRAIEKMRLVRIERDDAQEELRALQRDTAGPTAREMELRLTIDELRDEVEELRARGDPAAEPMHKFRKGTADLELLAELDALREQVAAQQQEIDRLRLATKPKQSRQELMDKRDALMQEIGRLERQLESGKNAKDLEWAKRTIEKALSGVGERAVFEKGGGGLPKPSALLQFAKKDMFDPKTKNKEMLMEQLITALNKTIEYWTGRLQSDADSMLDETRERWQSFIDAARFYLEQVIPNVEAYSNAPSEAFMNTVKTSLSTKRGQLTRVLKDLNFYEQNPNINSCLVCGETRQEFLWQERNNPTRVFCGKKCQAKSSAAPRAAPLSFLRHN